MKNLIQAAAVTLFAASTARAQQAVQWRVEDGGNGHWYQAIFVPGGVTWESARDLAVAAGGGLASLESVAERNFVFSRFTPSMAPGAFVQQGVGSSGWFGPWLGGYQATGSQEPAGGWFWLSGESFNPVITYCCNNDCGGANEDRLHLYFLANDGMGWNDLPSVVICGSQPVSYLVEWSADCNGDGIVDYGQCHNGTLPDYNGNNIPDCCERSEACVVGSYPVPWRVEDGGNGHWYQLVFDGHPSWTQAKSQAEQRGGYLATLTSQAENDLAGRLSKGLTAMLLGGFQDHSNANYSEPAGGWRWVTDEPWRFTNWGAGEPNNASNGHGDPGEDYLSSWTGAQGFKWGDGDNLCPECNPGPYLAEWSADCNNDGTVDYGQILRGQLADANADGVPDICQQPTCHDADVYTNGRIDGADLAALLSEWGPVTSTTRSDFDDNGQVNGADLAFLLSVWGSCP